MRFASSRLWMRPWRIEDLPAFAAIFGDPRVIYWGKHKRDLDEARAGLCRAVSEQDEPRPGLGRFAVVERKRGAVVGNVVLRPASFGEGIELGYHLAYDAWGQGYATEAARATLRYGFEVVGLERIVAATASDNARSLRVIEKLGMRPCGEIVHEGRPHRVFEALCPEGVATLRVRSGRLEELPAFVALLEEAAAWLWARGIPQWAPGVHTAAMPALVRAVEHGALLLLEAGPTLAGGCILTTEAPVMWPSDGPSAAYLGRLALAASHRGTGFSALIIEGAERWARERGLSRLRLDCWDGNHALRALYAAHGFEDHGPALEGEWTVRLFEKATAGPS